ncbi:glycoside hydrolase family 97 protein [Amycolatopsis sp. YIM 10]|uniref:glycoside hydrolase family 97 protein n=1 Tax=Amycolatopsis sp. YIM 10 TaxID=2653857 RepID=UPI00128FE698|nr:glycoside hydrolase family 97 protein [Amycolatopsis sp. YIM 10]QFU93793.1 Retaining alpha-galactosidase precursor [Amycolatopsis sp. YIM 10]
MRKRAIAAAVLVAGSMTVAVPALGAAGEHWTITAPGMSTRAGAPVAEVALDQAGRLSLGVRRGATTVLEQSALGLEAAHADFTTGLELTGLTQRVVSEQYSTVTGRRKQHSLEASELTLKLTAESGQPFELVVRVAADGVAYRYVVPSPKWVTVVREASEFRVPGEADSFLLPYDNGRGDYESAHTHAKVSAQAPVEYGYPSLFHVGDSWLALMESDLDGRYGGSRLKLDDGSFRLVLPDPTETSTGPLATPWRTMVVGDLATVTESDLGTDLASPSKIADTSWIKPGVAAWSWWAEGTGDLQKQKNYVDYASKQGWEYNLVDSGWDASWIPELVTYSNQRNVKTWLWVRWQTIDTDSEREKLFKQYADWGAAGLKIDFVESDGQDRMRWYDEVFEAAAKYRLMLNFHGAPIPRGTERTWPHVVTVEAVKGAEGTKPKPGRQPFPAEHYLTLPFTRNLTGSMDFTPVTFSGVRPNSDAGELALSVVYESGVQHFADSPANYAKQPLAEQLLRVVPTTWDETKLLDGDPGKRAVLARRSGAEWFVGGIIAGEATRLSTGLGFLPPGNWIAEVYADGADQKITFSTQQVTPASVLDLPVAKHGGFTVHLRPAS